MLRLILLIALVLAATYLAEAVARQFRKQMGGPGAGGRFRQAGPWTRGRPANVQSGGELVACDRCGVFTPTAGALWQGKAGPFCSEACRRRATTVP